MGATVNGINIVDGEIHLPRHGSAWADVELDAGDALTDPITLVIADLTLALDVERGGVSAGIARYLLRGGLAWEREVKPRSYQSDRGVQLRTVIADLARDVGLRPEPGQGATGRGVVRLPPDRTIGTAYARPGSGESPAGRRVVRGRDVLSDRKLALAWWIEPDGSTRFGTRSPGEVAAEHRIIKRNLAHGIRVVGTESPAAFVPGMVFDGEAIDAVVIRIAARDFTLETYAP